MTVLRCSVLVELPGSRTELLPGLRHGDLSLNEPERYVQMLKELEDIQPV